MRQRSRRDTFNRKKPEDEIEIRVINPQHQNVHGQECVCLHGEKADIKMIVHVVDAVENAH